MTLLENHLEQITLSAKAIADLPFPPPKIFTNALLGNSEITNLIRDTEPHERALFSIDPNAITGPSSRRATRRATAFPGDENGLSSRKGTYISQEPRKRSAVASVLGGQMLQEIQQSTRHANSQRNGGGSGVNVDILLQGAEKLCAVYPVVGAAEKIASLRSRYKQIVESMALYEEKVSKQQSLLERMNKRSDFGFLSQDEEDDYEEGDGHQVAEPAVTEEDLSMEEQEIRELELKKRLLEERVAGMEKDLGGLLRLSNTQSDCPLPKAIQMDSIFDSTSNRSSKNSRTLKSAYILVLSHPRQESAIARRRDLFLELGALKVLYRVLGTISSSCATTKGSKMDTRATLRDIAEGVSEKSFMPKTPRT